MTAIGWMRSALATGLSLALGTGLAAQVVVEGRVFDETGQSVAGAAVQLDGSDRIAVTSREGYFTFSAVDPGTYGLTVEHIAYGTHSDSIVASS